MSPLSATQGRMSPGVRSRSAERTFIQTAAGSPERGEIPALVPAAACNTSIRQSSASPSYLINAPGGISLADCVELGRQPSIQQASPLLQAPKQRMVSPPRSPAGGGSLSSLPVGGSRRASHSSPRSSSSVLGGSHRVPIDAGGAPWQFGVARPSVPPAVHRVFQAPPVAGSRLSGTAVSRQLSNPKTSTNAAQAATLQTSPSARLT